MKQKISDLIVTSQTHPEFSQSDNSREIVPMYMGNIDGKSVAVTDARNLHKFLGNKEVFASWIKQRIEQYGFVEHVDYETYLENSKKGRPRIEYRISSDMAKEISMVERTERGKEARQYFIDCEERLHRIAPQEQEAALINWREKRVTVRDEHKIMSEFMKGYIQRTGDKQYGHAYSNECTFLTRLVLGMHPPSWAKKNGITGKVRDHMSTQQLDLLAYLENRDCALLDMDICTVERKQRLTALAARWMAERMEVAHD